MHTEIDVENPQDTLTDGMYAEVKLVLQGNKDALTVPVQADRPGRQRDIMCWLSTIRIACRNGTLN